MKTTESWISKDGYDTSLLADAESLNSPGTEIQKVRFNSGKYAHFHKEKTEFFFVISGYGEITAGTSTTELKPGVSIVVQPGQHHTFIVPEGSPPVEALMVKTNSSPEDTYPVVNQVQ